MLEANGNSVGKRCSKNTVSELHILFDKKPGDFSTKHFLSYIISHPENVAFEGRTLNLKKNLRKFSEFRMLSVSIMTVFKIGLRIAVFFYFGRSIHVYKFSIKKHSYKKHF